MIAILCKIMPLSNLHHSVIIVRNSSVDSKCKSTRKSQRHRKVAIRTINGVYTSTYMNINITLFVLLFSMLIVGM